LPTEEGHKFAKELLLPLEKGAQFFDEFVPAVEFEGVCSGSSAGDNHPLPA
jgi:hypothetical protein